ncbi:MAG: glycosyltransferase [Lachnospiraceae bacterium]|nr:glycosyltransferase [Lachnospiraceae bacterium]
MYSVEDFIQRVEASDGLVCYGTGKRFRTFLECFQGMSVLDKVIFCVDQNEELQGTNIQINNRFINIQPIASINKIRGKNNVLLITNLYYDDVLSDLAEKGLLQAIEYYCFTHLHGMLLEDKAMEKELPKDCRITKDAVIPKIIHYCWFGHNTIPDKYKQWMESWHKYCPDYEIREWNEDNYDITKNAYMYEAYQNRKWGFVPDYARLDIIYEYGGIYLDTDVELVQNLDDLLYQEGFAGFERETAVAFGLGFGAVKGLPMIKEMRDAYDTLRFANPDGSVNLTASPEYQTNFLLTKGLQLNGEYQRIGDLTIYPEKMFSGKCPYTRRIRLKPYTKSIHHYDASWTDDAWRRRNERFEAEMNS